MKVVLVRKRKYGAQPHYSITQALLLLTLGLSLLTVAGVAYAAYHYGVQQAQADFQQELLSSSPAISTIGSAFSAQPDARTDPTAHCQPHAPHSVEAQLNALALKLGQLQAEMAALDALGRELVKVSKFDQQEFNFDIGWERLIASYDPEAEFAEDDAQKSTVAEIKRSVSKMAKRLEDREEKLTTLEDLVRHQRRYAHVLPSGWPLKQGYVSSHYGWRKSVRGRKRRHNGIDIVAQKGANIYAVEAGEVTFSGRMRGYGNIVEIKHSDTYTTRYAHNKKNLVKKGDKVAKEQVIGLVGATGRATGDHVHFEVRQKDKPINPIKYLTATDTFKLSENDIQ